MKFPSKSFDRRFYFYFSDGPTAKLDMDLTQFKQVLISAIEEDDKFAGTLFNVFQKKVIGNR